jgi:hypothetical protein
MSLKFEIVNPLTYPGWDDLILSSGKGSFFHSSHWARVLHESYGYKPVYFVSLKDNLLETLFPFMEINSFLTGKRGVSLPFTDYCEQIIPDNSDISEIMDELIHFGKKAGWKYIEIRDGAQMPQNLLPFSSYYRHLLDISNDAQTLLSGFRDSMRRGIKKAEREGVKVNICSSSDSIEEFFKLNCMTRKRHGLPPQPISFFKKIHEHIISKDHGFVALADYNGQKIGGAVCFHFGKRGMYKYGASDSRYQHLRVNNLLIYKAIRYYTGKGYRSFCLGRTESKNGGLLQFKRGFRAEEQIIKYYRYDFEQRSFVKDPTRITVTGIKLFSNMPIPLLKFAGALLYRHAG